MLDVKFIRENPELVQSDAAKKGYDISIKDLLKQDETRRKLKTEADEIRKNRNAINEEIKQAKGKPDASLIEKTKQLKNELQLIEEEFFQAQEKFDELIQIVPNILGSDVPLGGEEDSVEIKNWGTRKENAEDHLEYMTKRGWVDFERGAKVAGAKFYYLKGNGALLENAIYQFALNMLIKEGFEFMTVPHMVTERIAYGSGFAPKSSEESNEYFVNDNLMLIGTAEAPLTGYHADEIINESELPLKYVGYSPCYRREAGAYGKHSRGLFRVHQFNKLEMYIFTTKEDSEKMHQEILSYEEKIWQALNIPYRVVNIAAGDLGAPAAKKYDIEYWSPVDNAYRELTSCSNCTDFQARNLNIRVRRKNGEVEILHTLNGTAVSLARSIIAIVENYQQSDGSLIVPEVLKPYLSERDII
ncbi:serine--tRNA ligase [Candidatus Saccharibacteria bacterium]|nr:serine--tRNA ligase [Candidatus Saccharibacteria bacterium]